MTVWIQNPFDNLPGEGYRKQRYWLMSEAFAAAGHKVVFWTSDFSHLKKEKRGLEGLEGLGFEVRLIPTLPYRRNVGWARIRSHRAYARTWVRMARTQTASPDVIIASLPSISAAAAAMALGRYFGAKVVVDIMDAWPETFERLAPRGFRWLAHALLAPLRRKVRRLYRDADLVTGVCARYGVLSARPDYALAYHGIELEAALAERAPTRAARPDAIRLVYAGTLGRTYDLETVLRAVAANPDFTLDVAGRWTGPVPVRVTAHGYLGREELGRLLEACDIGLIPMAPDSWVGMPYKICDYAKAGLRIVSSLGGESSALLEKWRCGETYRAGDAASLAQAVRRAMKLAHGDSRRMCEAELDAKRIYGKYVERIERGVSG